MKIHPLCEMVPRLSETARKSLKLSLQTSGFNPLLPIWTSEGQIVDGRHRHEFCGELGIPGAYQELPPGTDLNNLIANQLAGRSADSNAVALFWARCGESYAQLLERGHKNVAARAIRYKDDPAAWAWVAAGKPFATYGRTSHSPRKAPPPPAAPKPPSPEAPAHSTETEKLLKALKQPRTYAELGARLKLDPPALSALLLGAVQDGVALDLGPTHVVLSTPAADQSKISEEPLLPTVGDWFRVGVISDTHAGSKFMMRRELQDCVQWMVREKGVTRILHCGDWVQGCYTHSTFEVTTSGLDDQLRELSEWLPQIPGVKYIGIAGNHDETFTAKSGRSFASELHGAWSEFRRSDVQIVGAIGAFVRIGGALIYLWHGGRPAYSLSYHLQRHAQQGFAALKPSVLLDGHVHQSCHVETRGIECLLVPCFQGGASPFAKLFPGSPSIGGYVLNWRLQAGGSFRDFEVSKRRYYERERIHTDSNEMPGALVDPACAGVTVVP
jgi:predicted phosphodiesterase